MANKFYNYRVRAVQTAAANPMPQGGTGYLDFTNTGSYNQFDSVVSITAGSEERFVYRITAASEASKYEYESSYNRLPRFYCKKFSSIFKKARSLCSRTR